MTSSASPIVTIIVPADVRYFRPVRLAVGGLATMAGFDIEAIDDLRIAVDEICALLAEAGDGSDLRLEICATPDRGIRIEGWSTTGEEAPDQDRFTFSRQILSVVADEFAYDIEAGRVHCTMARDLQDGTVDRLTSQ